jgi:hypothetical protein
VVGLSAPESLANNGRYLPNGFDLTGIDSETYFGAGPTEYNQQLVYSGDVIGDFHFTYDRWSGNDTASGRATGGGVLAGGFTTSPFFETKQNFELSWVQIVSSTFSGANDWGAPNGAWFPDTTGRNDPRYPFRSLPTTPGAGTPAVDPEFQDFPNRYFFQGNQTWRAELGLVLIDMATNELRVLGSFTWGFDIIGDPNVRSITSVAPGGFTPGGSSQLFDTLNDAFDGNGLTGGNPANSKVWFINPDAAGAYTIIPAPGTMLAFAAGGLFAVRRRRAS